MKKVNILGVGISQTTQKEAIEMVDGWLSCHSGKYGEAGRIQNRREADSGQARMTRFIATPNPEMLVLAQKDKEFRDILNKADLAIADGIGLVWVSKLVGKTVSGKDTSGVTRRGSPEVEVSGLTERVSGIDLMLSLCALACQKGYTIGLLGGREGVAEKIKEILEKRFPGIKIAFAVKEISDLSNLSHLGNPSTSLGTSLNVDLLFVAYGAPKQEKFIFSNFQSPISNLHFKVAMGVGGAFDLISGKIKRAPKLMQNLGLEWLWRVICEPRRIKRIWIATVVFPWLVVKSLFKSQPQTDVSSE